MAVSGAGLGMVTVGGLVFWSGITGKPFKDIFTTLASGKTVPAPLPSLPGTNPAIGFSPGGSIAGQAIAANALGYVGQLGYTWGGSFNSGSPDCSGFVNGILGANFRLAIPGYKAGTFDGSVHGPSSFAYPLWGGAVRISRKNVEAGDLLVWMNPTGHIGIAVSNTQLVSDLDPSQGVQVTDIGSTDTGALVCLRLKASITASISTGTHQAPGTHTIAGRG